MCVFCCSLIEILQRFLQRAHIPSPGSLAARPLCKRMFPRILHTVQDQVPSIKWICRHVFSSLVLRCNTCPEWCVKWRRRSSQARYGITFPVCLVLLIHSHCKVPNRGTGHVRDSHGITIHNAYTYIFGGPCFAIWKVSNIINPIYLPKSPGCRLGQFYSHCPHHSHPQCVSVVAPPSFEGSLIPCSS